jgi:hypothetical protein
MICGRRIWANVEKPWARQLKVRTCTLAYGVGGWRGCGLQHLTTTPSTAESRSPLDSEITFPFNQSATQFQSFSQPRFPQRTSLQRTSLRLASANIEADEDGWTEDIRNFQKASGWELESCRRSTYPPKSGI